VTARDAREQKDRGKVLEGATEDARITPPRSGRGLGGAKFSTNMTNNVRNWTSMPQDAAHACALVCARRCIYTYPMWTNDHAIPIRECHVIWVSETIADGAIADTLFSLFQLVQKDEVARNCTVKKKRTKDSNQVRRQKCTRQKARAGFQVFQRHKDILKSAKHPTAQEPPSHEEDAC
jgi:hypothetical protein